MTLDFHGQEIDISSIDTARMSNKERTAWIEGCGDLLDTVTIECSGLMLSVIKPHDLIAYKKELDGEHQLEDIQAIQEYLLKS